MKALYWSYFGSLTLVVLGSWKPGIYLVPLTAAWDLWLTAFCRMMRHTGDPRYYRKTQHSR
jgi:hypothetical protein